MEFLRNYDLNFVCRVFEWCAIISLIAGIIVSFVLGIETTRYETNFNFFIIFVGILVSFMDAMFWLFLSRIGDAIDDIRNKYVGIEEEAPTME